MPRAKKQPTLPYNTGDNEKIAPPPGRAYGARAAAETALKLVPAAGPQVDTAAQPPADVGAMLGAAQAYNPGPPLLPQPSVNPGEPVTTGLDTGPGAGSSILAMPDPTKADVQTWRAYLPTLEYLASLPGSTASTRNFVRRLRSVMPPGSIGT